MATSAIPPSMGAREWALLLILSALWGCSFYYFKILVAELPPFTVVLGRVGLAALLLNAFLLIRRDPLPRSPQLWGSFLVMGLLNNVVPFTLIAWGETQISSGLASILNATTPVFTVLVAHACTSSEKLNWNKGIGVLFAILGVAVLIGPTVIAGIRGGDTVGALACLAAALSYSIAGIYGRRFTGLPPLKVAAGQISGSTLLLIPLACLTDKPWALPMPSAHAWEALAGLAILCTAIAYMIYFRLLATAGATNLLLVTFLLPVSALLLGVLFLGETFTARAFGGMLLIGLGLAAIDGRAPGMLRRWILPRAIAVPTPASRTTDPVPHPIDRPSADRFGPHYSPGTQTARSIPPVPP
jgi:drug/metabolite transporter (DMT)-like permease